MVLRLLVILLASCLHVHQLTRDIRFHPDEAHFMRFARHAAVNGDWMLPGALDKPPLSIYASAVSMVFFGIVADDDGVLHLEAHQGEFAGRLPNVWLAIALTALLMRLARDIYRRESIALLAGLLMAASPYMLAFGATAFTDMSLLFWSMLTLWLILRRRFLLAGLALGLAFWSKQQAVWTLPLILVFIPHQPGTGWRRWLFGWLFGLALLMLWDAARAETSLFLLGGAHNLPASLLAAPASWLARLTAWLGLASWLIAVPPLTLTMVAVAVASRGKCRRMERLLLIYILAYLAAHTLLAFNQYDRYLLPIAPLLVLLMTGRLTRRASMAALTGGLLILSALWSVNSDMPGGDRSQYEGIDALADYLNGKPVAAVIYDPWLGWELGYYMGQWSDKRRVHYPTPETLAAGALELDEIGARYLVAPRGQAVDVWLASLGDVGFSVFADYQSERFIVYRLRPPTYTPNN